MNEFNETEAVPATKLEKIGFAIFCVVLGTVAFTLLVITSLISVNTMDPVLVFGALALDVMIIGGSAGVMLTIGWIVKATIEFWKRRQSKKATTP